MFENPELATNVVNKHFYSNGTSKIVRLNMHVTTMLRNSVHMQVRSHYILWETFYSPLFALKVAKPKFVKLKIKENTSMLNDAAQSIRMSFVQVAAKPC